MIAPPLTRGSPSMCGLPLGLDEDFPIDRGPRAGTRLQRLHDGGSMYRAGQIVVAAVVSVSASARADDRPVAAPVREATPSAMDESLCGELFGHLRQPPNAKTCVTCLGRVRQRLAAGDVRGAIGALDLMGEQLDAIFDPGERRCQGTLPGGQCSHSEALAFKTREVFTSVAAVRPRAKAMVPLVTEIHEARERLIQAQITEARRLLESRDLVGARNAYAGATEFGGVDEQLAAALVAAEVEQTLADNRRKAEAAGPRFRDGDTSWYPAPVYRATVRRLPDFCAEHFGAGASLDEASENGKSAMVCSRSSRRPATDEELARLREPYLQNEQLPPSRQRSRFDVLRDAARSQVGPSECPAEMVGTSMFDTQRLGGCLQGRREQGVAAWEACSRPEGKYPFTTTTTCRAAVTLEQFCPRGKILNGACVVRSCPPGLDRLEDVTDGHIAGCFKCSLGEFDVGETIAATGKPDANLMSFHGDEDVREALCRVGKARKAAKAARKPKR